MQIKQGSLGRIGRMPMPIDLLVEYTDGTMEVLHSVAHDEFRKKNRIYKRTVLNDWAWAYPTYELTLLNQTSIKKIIDPSGLMADIKRKIIHTIKVI
jgi:hypothetical protein